MAHSQDRRSFLRFLTVGLGTLFAAVLGAPAIMYLLDPRHRKGTPADLRLVDGIRLNDVLDTPRQGVIRAVRVDGWNLHPNDVIGRVWVVRDATARDGYRVFTTICPHLGCSVNLGEESGFACPCHNARFELDGARKPNNPALRGMDELEWQRDETDQQLVRVRYQAFQSGTADKTPLG